MPDHVYGCFAHADGRPHVVRDDPGGGVMVGFESDEAFVVLLRLSPSEAVRLRQALGRFTGEEGE